MAVESSSVSKYDRQIRVWGRHGQEALHSARVCVLGTHMAVLEAAKNLALAGISSLVIVDDTSIVASDVQTNYFVTGSGREYIGEAAVETLIRMNPDITIEWIHADPRSYVVSDGALAGVDVAILEDDATLVTHLDQAGVRSISVQTNGFFGYIKPRGKAHVVLEPNRPTPLDLQLKHAWPELIAFLESQPTDVEEEDDFLRIPSIVFLHKALTAFEQQHGQSPSHPDMAALRTMLQGFHRDWSEINVEEALTMVNTQLLKPATPSFPAILHHQTVDALVRKTGFVFGPGVDDKEVLFWTFAAALKAFMARNHRVPVTGKIPDMHGSTEIYVNLQRIYQRRAASDRAELHADMVQIAQSCGDSDRIRDVVADMDQEILTLLVKNASNLTVVSFSSSVDVDPKQLAKGGVTPTVGQQAILWASSREFESHMGHVPGLSAVESDVVGLSKIVNSIVERAVGESPSDSPCMPSNQMIREFVIGGHCELAPTCSVLGGIMAQEAVKLLTSQFVPFGGQLFYYGSPEAPVMDVIE
ncbi:ubiquitin activating enzyme [Carpediemonas membranifera]|uniref:Ubiquitin activating enzyme n=1 Tax=Carpediemonas membranifera TaxID=201153 RepID=A0A8J6E1E9_9EUKA|nr:ubiquitin activating enzyme [Carpediemonas membranifera]|eukprot:KAG9396264.1 ubiquitin activating enzyme [Carpediemonas membranifera]